MAHTKAKGSTKNGRDSQAQRLGVKRQHGQTVGAGEILIRQRGTKYLPGLNVARAKDDSLYAMIPGTLQFLSRSKVCFNGNRREVKVLTIVAKTAVEA
ncbi:MAG: 50S ribosomal protein L27 [Candidatus Wolfebacteria bacterium GW2011_GWC2_39_22]|uniref:Large ribosomal subunit protein bL27 n=2 Tax=Candidatus Wolfeibacteriota TaxID=1752735 RepID=A0A0G1HAN0_9BACT|nr:MAG: 50S ribosomal protein L27 [Candidatus Wolfebacteria bacterium GW2011_GWC2_39_22]KKT43840.1 MAG: 50S ribosomal protein L27 [Candidatus Wolfebacteria bacterium GW2011_GWE2_44_13]HBI25433.1 50S ribosomal protein L27 [Candidatus Wolfebacteria bacterium]